MKLTHRITGLTLLALLATLPATAATYSIDPTHSSALFKVKHFGVTNFYAAFKNVSGTIHYDADKLEASSIEVTIAAESVDSRDESRDKHIKSPDFLNAKQFPTITFKSTGIVAGADGKLTVTGNLTLLGVTKPVTAMVEKTGEGENPVSGKHIVGFEAHFTVDRGAHDMNFMSGPLSDEVEFLLSVEAAR